jgi:hypothetical protein
VTLWLLTAVWLGAAPARPASQPQPVLMTELVERLPLPARPGRLEVDVWAREVRLTTAEPNAVARAVGSSRVCPKVEVRDGRVVLRCRTGQLRAELVRGRRGAELSLAQLRGLPSDDARAQGAAWHYPPELVGLGGACPGTTPEGRGECLLAQRRTKEAVPLFTEALSGPNQSFAALRLADLALAAGDWVAALAQYEAIPESGLWGRVAAVRRCELVGCEQAEALYASARLPAPVATELGLRHVRFLALSADVPRALQALQQQLVAGRDPCQGWPRVCADVVSAALRHEDLDVVALGLEAFLREQEARGPARDAAMLRVAADAAGRLGAPFYAANLLASATPLVPPARLGEHLAAVAGFFDAAGDAVRANVIRDYARARLKRPLKVQAAAPASGVELSAVLAKTRSEADLAIELAQAMAAASRSRASAVLGARAVVPPEAPPAASPRTAALDGGAAGPGDGGLTRGPDAGLPTGADAGVKRATNP